MKGNIVKVFSAMACVFAFNYVQGMDAAEFNRKFAELNQKCLQVAEQYGWDSRQFKDAERTIDDFQKNDPNAAQWQAEQQAQQRQKERGQLSAKWQAAWRQEQAEKDYLRKLGELNQDCLDALNYGGVRSPEYQEAKRIFDNFLETVPNPALHK